MLDVDTRIRVAIFSGMVAGTMMLLIIAYFLVLTAVKDVKFTNWGDVESCVNSRKFTKEKIIRAKPITAKSCFLQYYNEYSIYTDSGALQHSSCVTNKRL
ncbi:protein FAM24A-like [Alexandromys fortis]|uniref:protein FAM24A-like n=1 Tax=Alexandromys fortis TaxID=100897 RepID=UPI0021525C48|nr:protein FAM24A-like [Microtus fortis]